LGSVFEYLRRSSYAGFRAGRPGLLDAQMLTRRLVLAAGCPAGLARSRTGMAGRSGGQHPGAALAGQALADQVTQVEGGGAALEPGVVPGGPAVAELEAASPPGGDLGDGAFDVGPVLHVVLAQPRVGGPVRAGGPEQVITLVQDELAAGLAGGAPVPQRAVAAQDAEGGDPGAAQSDGAPGRAGDRADLLVHGEVIDGEPALDRGLQRLGLDHRLVAGVADRAAQVPGAVGGIAVPGQAAACGGAVIWLARAARRLAVTGAGRGAGRGGLRRAGLGGQELLRHCRVGV